MSNFTRRALCAAALAALPGAPHAQTIGVIEHVWKPVRTGNVEVVAIEVRTEMRGLSISGKTFSLSVPITYAGVAGIADRTEALSVRDATGPVALRTEDDPPNPAGFPFYRHFRAERVVQFPLTVTYRALTPRAPVRGPPFGLWANYGGVSGAGSGFLVLPETEQAVHTRVHWDLTDLAPGSQALTSFGDGDFTLTGSASEIRNGWIMAGPIGRYAGAGSAAGFSAAWLGTPSWDPDTEMTWAARMYAWLGASYAYLKPLPAYRVFIRVGGPRAGTSLASSFMGFAAPRAEGAAPQGESARETFTHEMGHLFVGGIDAPDGVSSWFSEGLNVYYTRLLPMRGGFTTVAQYGNSINATFREYYFGGARNLSADSIARIGFNDETVRHMPYVRGSLYFANLNSQIRARSRGRRNLDMVIRELFERRAAGTRITHASWAETVAREAGPSARDDFEHIIIRGDRTLVPTSDAFGACFERRATPPRIVDGTAHGAGFEWRRVASVPDSVCRTGDSR